MDNLELEQMCGEIDEQKQILDTSERMWYTGVGSGILIFALLVGVDFTIYSTLGTYYYSFILCIIIPLICLYVLL